MRLWPVIGALWIWLALPGTDGSTTDFALPPDAVQTCARSVLEQRGEALLRDDPQGRLVTSFRFIPGDELAQLAVLPDTDVGAWPEGMFQLQLMIEPGVPGHSTVTIEPRFLGRHTTPLPLLRPSPWERLTSSGVVEQVIADGIQSCVSGPDPPDTSGA